MKQKSKKEFFVYHPWIKPPQNGRIEVYNHDTKKGLGITIVETKIVATFDDQREGMREARRMAGLNPEPEPEKMRAFCAGCGRGVEIDEDNKLKEHYKGGGGPGRPLPCWGSGTNYKEHGDPTGRNWANGPYPIPNPIKPRDR